MFQPNTSNDPRSRPTRQRCERTQALARHAPFRSKKAAGSHRFIVFIVINNGAALLPTAPHANSCIRNMLDSIGLAIVMSDPNCPAQISVAAAADRPFRIVWPGKRAEKALFLASEFCGAVAGRWRGGLHPRPRRQPPVSRTFLSFAARKQPQKCLFFRRSGFPDRPPTSIVELSVPEADRSGVWHGPCVASNDGASPATQSRLSQRHREPEGIGELWASVRNEQRAA